MRPQSSRKLTPGSGRCLWQVHGAPSRPGRTAQKFRQTAHALSSQTQARQACQPRRGLLCLQHASPSATHSYSHLLGEWQEPDCRGPSRLPVGSVQSGQTWGRVTTNPEETVTEHRPDGSECERREGGRQHVRTRRQQHLRALEVDFKGRSVRCCCHRKITLNRGKERVRLGSVRAGRTRSGGRTAAQNARAGPDPAPQRALRRDRERWTRKQH